VAAPESGLFEEAQNSFVHTLNNVDNTIRGFGRIGDPITIGGWW
jgi:hypothetical protein